jgi:hypothetical protein
MPRDADIFADPYLDGPPAPKLRLLAACVTDGADVVDESHRVARRRRRPHGSGRGREGERALDGAGHPLERLAGQVALTDFAAVYLALGLGMDPGLSPHVADLRDFTGE